MFLEKQRKFGLKVGDVYGVFLNLFSYLTAALLNELNTENLS